MLEKYGLGEGALDIVIVLLVIYPLGIARAISLICPTLDSCGPIIAAILTPAAFMGFLFLFGGFLIFIPVVLFLILSSFIVKVRRYSQNSFSLFHILYSIPFIALTVIAANFLL